MGFYRRMRSSNVLGFASKVLTLYEEEVRRIRKRLCSAVRLYAHAQFNFYIVFLCNGIHNIPLLSTVTEKRVSVPEAHKILSTSLEQLQTTLWILGVLLFLVGCEQTRHSLRKKLTHSQKFVQNCKHTTFWYLWDVSYLTQL